ncbi:alkane hydroxylase MAH1-like [Andrographis paniculata]|uniref:alkane hydroxylase MAH1-like n=1 Tax=Andrographis paniculata TaxID=175694 RepID=UPI0021E78635|nr:alkane hydroxylase MAH1-like [Andrographis paniculata]
MATAIIIVVSFWFVRNSRMTNGSALITDWPVVGMLPALLPNLGRVHDFATDILNRSGGTFFFKGPVFANMDMFATADPANVNYILSKNFSNFGKGPDFKKMFDSLGEGIFVADSKSWEIQRKIAKSAMSHVRFHEFVAATTWRKIETGLIPILDKFSDNGMEIDLQEVFQRFTFDCFCILVLGHDPFSLSEDFPDLPYEKAFAVTEEAVLYRHVLPAAVWSAQKWLGIGREKKLKRASDAIDGFLSYCISLKRGDMNPIEEEMNLLMTCRRALAEDNVVRDLMLNLIFAGKDTISATLTWFFWLLATNPAEEERIRNEIAGNSSEPGNWTINDMDAMNKLVCLHGAVCETLRLFPPVPIQHKAPVKDDVLPSGHPIKANTRTLLFFYSMGRMESIWGEDCLEFKPGRWISEEGRIKVEAAYKFPAFNAGPRTCLGKDVSFLQVKMAAAAMVSRFKIEVAEGHPVRPSESIVLHMKDGLKVRVSSVVSHGR